MIKVAELGKLMNTEKLKDNLDDNTMLFHKLSSMKDREISREDKEFLGEEKDCNSEVIQKKARGFSLEDKQKHEALGSYQSYTINSFEGEDGKKLNSFITHKSNFARTKRNLTNEFLEDLEVYELKKTKLYLNETNMKESKNLDIKKDLNKEEDLEAIDENKNKLLSLKNSFFLGFESSCDQSLIQDYEKNLANSGSTAYKANLLIYSFISLFLLFLLFFVFNEQNGVYWYSLISRIFLFIFPLSLFKYAKPIILKYKKAFIVIFFLNTYYFVYLFFNGKEDISNILELIFLLNVILNANNLYFLEVFMFLVLLCLIFIGHMIYFAQLNIMNWIEIVFLISNCICILQKNRKKHIRLIDQFNALRNNFFHKMQQESLITYLLPPHIFIALTQNNSQIVDTLDDVTILFADIAGFTKYSSSVSGLEVLSMLRELFTEFDKLCLNYKVYKLYTIGDCYVVLGVLDVKNRDPKTELFKVLMLAFDMIEIINNVKKKINFNDLNMRIGIHTVFLLLNKIIISNLKLINRAP